MEDVKEDGGRRTEDVMEDGGRRTEDIGLIPNILLLIRYSLMLFVFPTILFQPANSV